MTDHRTRALKMRARAAEMRMLSECATSAAAFDCFERTARTWEQMAEQLERLVPTEAELASS